MPDEKIEFLMRIGPAADREIKAVMSLVDHRSQNEFMKKVLQFYCDHVASQDCSSVLPPTLIATLRVTVQGSENYIYQLLFKLAVGMDMMMNVLAVTVGTPEEQLRKLRGHCIREVREIRDMIPLDDITGYQNGGD